MQHRVRDLEIVLKPSMFSSTIFWLPIHAQTHTTTRSFITEAYVYETLPIGAGIR